MSDVNCNLYRAVQATPSDDQACCSISRCQLADNNLQAWSLIISCELARKVYVAVYLRLQSLPPLLSQISAHPASPVPYALQHLVLRVSRITASSCSTIRGCVSALQPELQLEQLCAKKVSVSCAACMPCSLFEPLFRPPSLSQTSNNMK